MQVLHMKNQWYIWTSNTYYKLWSNVQKEFKTISVDNFVIVLIRPKWFPQETVEDLHARSVGFFNILKKFKLQYLCYRFGISSIFNIED